MDPNTFMLTMPKPLGCNVGGTIKFGLSSVLARASKEVPYGTTCVCSVCVTQRKMECNFSGVKTCNREALENLGKVFTSGSTWALDGGLSPI